ncbi:MAG: phosphonate metabolism transcriptional regulator PhnF [Pseudomonadota bacterium]
MIRTPLWREIEDHLRANIADGHYRPGDKLPTESALSARFGVNRHTVRRALASLQDAGLTHSRRGSGVYVTAKPTEYRLGRRTRFSQNLARLGQSAERKVLRLETRFAEAREAKLLELPPDSQVHVFEGIGLSDETPLSLFFSVLPATGMPGMLASLEETRSITEALRREGVEDYIRSWTQITAEAASASQAVHLQCREGAALVATQSLNRAVTGAPVEFGQTWFVGERIQLVIEAD